MRATKASVPKLRLSKFKSPWQEKTIGERLSKVVDYRGKAPPKTEVGMPLITARNVRMGYLDFATDEYIDQTQYKSWMNRGLPEPDDVLFTTEAPLGNVALYPSKGTYALGQRIITLQTKKEELDSIFLFQFLLSPVGQRKVDKRGTGSTAKGIKSKLFIKIPMSIPCLSEQKKIAAFLSAVDAKIAALRKRQERLERYKKGLMQALFSQRLRFTKPDGTAFPGWEEKRLREVFSWHKTNSLSRENLNYEAGDVQNIHYGDIHTKFKATFRQTQEIVPFVSEGAIPNGFSDDEFLRNGDVVIADASEDYADVGKAIEIVELGDRPLVAGLHTYIARPRGGVVVGFSGYLLRSEVMRRQIMRIAQGISVLGVSKTNLEKLELLLPHPDEQQKIADALSAIDAKIASVGTQVDKMEAFKKGLLQQMFV